MPYLRPTVITILALLLAPVVLAQFPSPVNNDTRTPVPGSGHDYINMLNETVDPSNGSLSVHISTPVPPSRGITIPFSFDYSSGAVLQVQEGSTGWGSWGLTTITGGVLHSGGWSYRIPELTANQPQVICYIDGGGGRTLTTQISLSYIFTDPSGTRHNLGLAHIPTLNPDCSYLQDLYSVSSGGDDFYGATLNQTTGTVTVGGVDGTVYNFSGAAFGVGTGVTAWLPSTIEDRNGNVVTISEGSGGNITETDTVGRSAVSTSARAGTNGTVSIPGLSNAYTVTWETMGFGYGSQYEQIGNGPPACNWLTSGGGSGGVIKSIELPNQTYYTFGYDGHGLLNQITYPTGAVVTYTWNTPSSPNGEINFWGVSQPGTQLECTYGYYAPMVTQRTVKFDGVHTSLVQNFTYTTAFNAGVEQATVATTVYSSDGGQNRGTFKTVYNYADTDFYVSDPDDQVSFPTSTPVEQTVQYYDYGQTNLLETVTKAWQDQFRLACQLETHDGSGLRGTFYSYGPGLSLTNEEEYDYGQISGTNQCPQAAGGGPIAPPTTAPTRETVTTYYQSFANAPATVKIYLNGASGTLESETDYSYDQSTTSSASATNHDGTNYGPGSTTPRGNATTVVTKCLQSAPACSSGNPTTTYSYDETGQVTSMKDPCGNGTCSDMTGTTHTTTYSYADSYTILSGGSNIGYTSPKGNTDAYLTSITNAFGQTAKFTYDYNNGQLTDSQDQNDINAGRVGTTYIYNDPFARPKQVNYPDGGKTTLAYNDAAYNTSTPSPSVTTTKAITSSTNLVSVSAMDGLGHTVEKQLTSDPDGIDYTVTTLDGLAEPFGIFNPTRCNPYQINCGETTWGFSTHLYDALGRTIRVTNPDGTFATTSYAGRATSVVDEGNVQRITQVDGLGRLTSVCEVTSATQLGSGGTPGACGQDITGTGFLTTYSYDALGNLLAVNQGSLGQRTFAYDSLSRLLCAANPETGTATCPSPDNGTYTAFTTRYGYDADGNLTSRTRPAPNQTSGTVVGSTSYQYDALNRLTQKSYSDGTTPNVMFGYDQASVTMGTQQFNIANSVGRLSWECTLSPTSCPTMHAFSYDPMGRTAQLWECQYLNCQLPNIVFSYDYDLSGDELDYFVGNNPHGSVEYVSTYNGAGRLVTHTSPTYVDATNPENLLTGVHYDPFGHMTSGNLANGLSLSWAYDARGRQTAMAVGTGCASGNCSTNKYRFSISYTPNSNIASSTDTVNGNWTYTYDGLNRLSTGVANNGEGCSWDYDRYGNRWHQNAHSGTCLTPQLTFSGNNNRIDGYSYDADGNLLNDGVNNYLYDGENRIVSVDGGATTYVYDAEGRRFSKTTGGVATETIYDRMGNPRIRGNFGPSEVFVAGMHLGTSIVNSAHTDSIFYYDHDDWLGTERARTDLSGNPCETITSLPFGDNQTIASTCGDLSPLHFTGKERDSESNLDMFGARYYASTMGRFITPDWSSAPMAVPYAVPGNPQSLNLYGYTKNNPTTLTDPNGHCWGWAQTLCDAVQVGVNYLDGNGAKTNAELAHDTAAYNRNWYVNHAGGNKEQFDKMTDKQVNDFDRAYQNGDSSFTSDGVKFVIAAAANAAPMLGANGTQVTSKTLWNQGSGRIDVENPNPGQRPGQIHYQDGAGKYIYDVGKGEFQGLSATQNRELLSQPEVQQAIQKGLKYLGAAQ